MLWLRTSIEALVDQIVCILFIDCSAYCQISVFSRQKLSPYTFFSLLSGMVGP